MADGDGVFDAECVADGEGVEVIEGRPAMGFCLGLLPSLPTRATPPISATITSAAIIAPVQFA